MNFFSLFLIFYLFNVIHCQSTITVYDLTPKDEFNLHHAFVPDRFLWPAGRIYFKMDSRFHFDEVEIILNAMYEIERFSCIRFKPYDYSNGPNYVKITRNENEGCYALGLGNVKKGEQVVNIENGCLDVGSIIHELMHVIGFAHHHSRSDRDRHLTVWFENIIELDKPNFQKLIQPSRDVRYLTPIDTNSIMLYGNDFFSKNDRPTLTARNNLPLSSPSQKSSLSKYDKVLLNKFYKCSKSSRRKDSFIFYSGKQGLRYPRKVKYNEIIKARSNNNWPAFNDDDDDD